MYVVAYNNQSVNRLQAVLSYFGMFVKSSDMELAYHVVFRDNVFMINSNDTEGLALVHENLHNEGLLRTDFNLRKDYTKALKSFKHVLIWHLMHSDYFGIVSSKEIIEQMVDADQDYFNFLGEGTYAFINDFSQSAKSLEIIGYSRLIRDIIPLDIRMDLLEFVESCVDVPFQYFEQNPEKFKGSESLMISFNRFKEDILAIRNYNIVYNDLFI